MRESCELRVREEYADLLFRKDEGKRLGDTGSIRKIVIDTNDPRWPEIGVISRELRKTGKYFFAGWHFFRKYSREELEKAVLFNTWPATAFEPAGEVCGTNYDETSACPKCGAGAVQTNDLRLDFRKIPRGKDIAVTIANELIISQRLAELLTDAGATGFSLRPTRHKARYEDDSVDLSKTPSGHHLLEQARSLDLTPTTGGFWVWLNRPEQRLLVDKSRQENAEMKMRRSVTANKQWPVWHQFIVDSTPVHFSTQTRFGNKPFDEDEEGKNRCPLGHVLGLNILSELYIKKSDWDGSDFVRTVEFVGTRRGLLRPRNFMLASPKVRNLFLENKIKGAEFEVAYLV
ncbi:MAG: hypothetical protein ACLPSW_01755 [Roseiarcus sp.]